MIPMTETHWEQSDTGHTTEMTMDMMETIEATEAQESAENQDNASVQMDDKEPSKFHCDACSTDVTNTMHIRCADNDCPDFDLCITCFSSGAEPIKHKTWHAYRIVKPLNFPIFAKDWDADEELLLIEAAEKNGLGNWQAIAEYVGTKTENECRQHYLDVYVASDNWPLPRMDLEFDKACEAECRERKRRRLQQLRTTLSRAKAPTKNATPVISGPTYHEIQGYMPRRFEFETEYENEAEQFVKDMVFNEDDTQEEVDLKLMVLDIYNSRLDRRMERKRLIFERGWLAFKKRQAMERRWQQEEREIYERTRVFCRLQTPPDYEMLVQGLVRERRLRDRIAALQEWRQAGLTSLRQGEQYEKDKQQRVGLLKAMSSLSNERSGTGATTANQRNSYRAQLAALTSTSGNHRDGLSKSGAQTNGSIGVSHNSASSGGRKPAMALNISEADGVHLLTEQEQQLCSTLRIMPRPYMTIKDVILKEYAKQGFLKRRQARELIKIDVNKTSRIYDFFIESGWIKAFREPSKSVLSTVSPSTVVPTLSQIPVVPVITFSPSSNLAQVTSSDADATAPPAIPTPTIIPPEVRT